MERGQRASSKRSIERERANRAREIGQQGEEKAPTILFLTHCFRTLRKIAHAQVC